MRARFVFFALALVALATLPVAMGGGGQDATAAPPGWVSLIVPGLASDSAPAAAPSPPTATGIRGLRIYVELEMFNEDRWQTLVGDIRLPDVPPVFTQPIKVRGKFALSQGASASSCSWEQRLTIDNQFWATIYWTPNANELLVEFDWPEWEDWAICPESSVKVAAPYPLQFHANAVFGGWRDPVFFFNYLVPLDTTPTSTITSHRANYALIGQNTKGKLQIDFCREESIRPLCDWPPFGGP